MPLEALEASYRAVGAAGIPVLLIWGTEDKVIPFETSEQGEGRDSPGGAARGRAGRAHPELRAARGREPRHPARSCGAPPHPSLAAAPRDPALVRTLAMLVMACTVPPPPPAVTAAPAVDLVESCSGPWSTQVSLRRKPRRGTHTVDLARAEASAPVVGAEVQVVDAAVAARAALRAQLDAIPAPDPERVGADAGRSRVDRLVLEDRVHDELDGIPVGIAHAADRDLAEAVVGSQQQRGRGRRRRCSRAARCSGDGGSHSSGTPLASASRLPPQAANAAQAPSQPSHARSQVSGICVRVAVRVPERGRLRLRRDRAAVRQRRQDVVDARAASGIREAGGAGRVAGDALLEAGVRTAVTEKSTAAPASGAPPPSTTSAVDACAGGRRQEGERRSRARATPARRPAPAGVPGARP